MKDNWVRDYHIVITPDNVKSAIKAINKTLKEACKCYREIYRSPSVGVNFGPAVIYITSVKCGTFPSIDLFCEKINIGSIPIDTDMYTMFAVSGVDIHEDGFVDYQSALISFEIHD